MAFISALMERKIDFVACDNPTATKFTIHILAAVAEFERATRSASARGKRSPPPRPRARSSATTRIAKAKQEATDARAEAMRPAITSTLHVSATAAADASTVAASPRPGGLRKSSASVVASASPPPPPNRLDYRGLGI